MQRRQWLPLLALFVVAFAGTLLAGCFGRECDGSSTTIQDTDGRKIDDNTWESNAIDGEWLMLPHQGRIVAAYVDVTNGVPPPPDWVNVYISPSPRPTDPARNGGGYASFTLAGGNVAKLFYRPGIVEVYNDSCSDFFARILIHGELSVPSGDAGADGGDGGNEAGFDSGVSDAGAVEGGH